MSQLRFNKRQDLIDALNARRPWAEGYDERVTAKHQADEKAALDKFKKSCAEFARMSAARLKAMYDDDNDKRELRYGVRLNMPSCPSSAVAMLDQALALLKVTRQETFVLSDERNSVQPVAGAYWLLTHNDKRAKSTVC